jgi:hypothetical protein
MFLLRVGYAVLRLHLVRDGKLKKKGDTADLELELATADCQVNEQPVFSALRCSDVPWLQWYSTKAITVGTCECTKRQTTTRWGDAGQARV